MKLYDPTPELIIRVRIAQSGKQDEFINLNETTMKEVHGHFKKVLSEMNLSPFADGSTVSVQVRESRAGKNGKQMSLSFKGMTPTEVKKVLIKSIK